MIRRPYAHRPLTRSREDYVKALFALGGLERAVTVSEVSRRLGVSAPSATNMLARLARERLVERGRRGESRLTASGGRRALATVRRHRLLETFLVRALALDWAAVHEEAEVLEHVVSERVLAAIDRLLRHPTEDPHGHPIPDRRGRLPRRALLPLAELPAGARAVVRELRDRDPRRLAGWRRCGLVPGAAVRVRRAALGGARELEVNGRLRSLGRASLAGVLVEPAARATHGA